ncbi:MAG TPA: IPT/TIG domain-containing protein [Candidatus Sulfotelmatobacter sp.]|nr:IPT/TIG domain-containing protein [Candidatus Sulfotelmatobacter sp.]HEV2468320.1 IPT/TIG domain-containing protein [Candidatus Sulfotelmatobacter sp.]
MFCRRRFVVPALVCLFALSLAQASVVPSAANPSDSTNSARTSSNPNSTRNAVNTPNNPIPVLTSISPATAYVNSAGFTLTAIGSGFVNTSSINWNNVALPTTYVSSTKLTAVIPSSDLSYTGTDYVTVYNPAPGGGYSTTLYFYVISLDPSINSITPTSVLAGSAPTVVTVYGYNFMSTAKVQWNGKSVPTTYVNTGELQFTPSKAEISSASIAQLSVVNPPPGGVSPSMNFNVTYPYKSIVLDLPANDLVWDPYAQRIYASLPSSYGSKGNTIAVINPNTGAITGYYFAGSEPYYLALSNNSSYLYASLNGNGSVQRLILPGFTPDIDISLGDGYNGPNIAGALQVSPSDPHTFAVSVESGCCYPNGLYFYKDSTQLPDNITYPSMSSLAFVSSGTLYGYYSGTVSQVNVDSNGGTLGQQWNGLIQGSEIAYSAGLIYGNDGQVLNPTTGLLVGTYDMGNSCCSYGIQVVPNSAVDRVFALGQTPFSPNALAITSYDLAKFTPIAIANLSQLSGNTMPTFISWGNNGLAFTLQTGCCGNTSAQTVILQSTSLVAPSSGTNPVPVAQSLAPSSATHGGGNFPLTLTGSGFVPSTSVTWNGTSLATAYVSPTQLTVYVPASSIASAGTAKVVATNPAPGGGKSATLNFTIN